MRACILKTVLGSDRNLLIDKDTFSWVSQPPDDCWILGSESSIMSLDVVFRAVGRPLSVVPSEKWSTMWKQISNGSRYPLWSKMMPDKQYREYVSRVVDDTRMLLDDIHDTYFSKEFLVSRELILSLCQSKINEIRFYNIMSDEKNGKLRSISSFRPDDSGMARLPRYDQCSSATGRLTVKEGPNILTLNREYRDVLISRYSGGQILNIDFVSLEPRILYGINVGEPPADIYDTISRELFDGEIDRKTIKAATIGTIYGLSSRKFSLTIGEDDVMKASEILRGVRHFFNLGKLSSKLVSENRDTGSISNFYGRPLVPGKNATSNILVSHYVQSTGVDVSLMGFNSLIKHFESESIDFCPIFLIHDAILVDVHPSHISKIKSITKEGISVPGFEFKFPLDISKI